MKVLIWIGCFLVATILNAILGYATGIKAGALILYLVVCFVAKKLCKKWEQHREAVKETNVENKMQTFTDETIVSTNEICFCRKCGEKLMENSQFCRKCGAEVIKENGIEENEDSFDETVNWEFCKKCGADVSKDTSFCHVCGESISNIES